MAAVGLREPRPAALLRVLPALPRGAPGHLFRQKSLRGAVALVRGDVLRAALCPPPRLEGDVLHHRALGCCGAVRVGHSAGAAGPHSGVLGSASKRREDDARFHLGSRRGLPLHRRLLRHLLHLLALAVLHPAAPEEHLLSVRHEKRALRGRAEESRLQLLQHEPRARSYEQPRPQHGPAEGDLVRGREDALAEARGRPLSVPRFPHGYW
mmetsp:Transcript_11110/g.29511  ORF Transcript_11110/g.29511 Transcript_11110/m.29511 type:complete len:210 (-) Transcript_11110:40-669(-)